MVGIEQFVRHKKTNKLGKVLGYGHKIVGEAYLTTLKVKLLKEKLSESLIEDIYTAWIPCEGEAKSENCSKAYI